MAEPVPAVCPRCGKPQPLHLDIPDDPGSLLAAPAATSPEPTSPVDWSMEELSNAGPPPIEPGAAASPPPPGASHPPRRSIERRGITGLLVLVAGITIVGALAAIPFDVAPRDEGGQIASTGRTAESQLAIGDCYGPDLELGEAFGGAVTATPCDEPHLWEVVGRLNYPSDEYPGEATIERWAIDLCRAAFEQYVGAPSQEVPGLEMWYRFPREVHWDQGARVTWCLATRGSNSTDSVRRGQ